MRALTAAAIATLFLAVSNQSANAQQPATEVDKNPPQGVASFVAELRELFAPFHIIPIIVPRGEQVGDFFDRQANILLASADDCFPKLKIRTQQGQLPSVFTVSSRGLAAALGASGVLEAEGGAAHKQTYTLSFRDVEVHTASVVQLRNALPTKSPQECELIRPFLQALGSAKPTPAVSIPGLKAPLRRVATVKADSKPPQIPIVIGTVFYARRVLRVDVIETLSGEANLSLGQKLLQGLGLGSAFKISTKADFGDFHSVEFVGNTLIPVAYAPAFDVAKMDIAEGKATLQISEINPEEIRINVALMEKLNGNKWATTTLPNPFASDRYEPPKYVLGAPPKREWEQLPEDKI